MKNLSDLEVNVLYQIITSITGTDQAGDSKRDILISNVSRLMNEVGSTNLASYLQLVDQDPKHLANFLSAITIHTTSWFREEEHFEILRNQVLQLIKNGVRFVHIWSAACSTGQEVYSIALCLELIRRDHPEFDYKVNGTDIDPISVESGLRAIYNIEELHQIPPRYLPWILQGKGRLKGHFTLSKTLRNKCRFSVENLDRERYHDFLSEFDIVFCRNVLIYFHSRQARQIVDRLKNRIKQGGLLVLGHSEFLNEYIYGLKSIGHSSYQKNEGVDSKNFDSENSSKKTILIVDDVPVIRTVLKANLLKNGYHVLEATDVVEAEKFLSTHRVDLISLDLNMPGKNGADWLRELRARSVRIPVIVVSASNPNDAEAVFGALGNGAQEYIEKETLGNHFQKFADTVKSILQLDSNKNNEAHFSPIKSISIDVPRVILIGASTGGPEAIWKLLKNFPKPSPPIIIVQHTNAFYAEHFAKSVEKSSGLEIGGKTNGEMLKANRVYIAHGDYHLSLDERHSEIYLRHVSTPALLGHRPSVDVLFESALNVSGPKTALLLTGMGKDGALGMKNLSDSGNCFNMAQSENSCVVYGMPKEAKMLGAVHFTGNIAELRTQLEKLISPRNLKKVA